MCCKGYDADAVHPKKFLDYHPTCKHPDKLHNMLKFLRQEVRDIDERKGWWSLWYDYDPLAEPAKDSAKNRMPKKEKAKTSEVKIGVDNDQLTKLKLRSRADRERSQSCFEDFFFFHGAVPGVRFAAQSEKREKREKRGCTKAAERRGRGTRRKSSSARAAMEPGEGEGKRDRKRGEREREREGREEGEDQAGEEREERRGENA